MTEQIKHEQRIYKEYIINQSIQYFYKLFDTTDKDKKNDIQPKGNKRS